MSLVQSMSLVQIADTVGISRRFVYKLLKTLSTVRSDTLICFFL